MTEDDTFRILSRQPFKELRKEMGYYHFNTYSEWEEFLLSKNWPMKDYLGAYYDENLGTVDPIITKEEYINEVIQGYLERET